MFGSELLFDARGVPDRRSGASKRKTTLYVSRGTATRS
jgi:hypothetical protein